MYLYTPVCICINVFNIYTEVYRIMCKRHLLVSRDAQQNHDVCCKFCMTHPNVHRKHRLVLDKA